MFCIEFVDLLDLFLHALRARVAHAGVLVRSLVTIVFIVLHTCIVFVSIGVGSCDLRCRYFGLRYVLCELKSLLSCCQFAHRCHFLLLGKRIRLSLEAHLLGILLGRLLLALCFLPLLAADVRTQATEARVLHLLLHLLEVFDLIRLILRSVGSLVEVRLRVLASLLAPARLLF